MRALMSLASPETPAGAGPSVPLPLVSLIPYSLETLIDGVSQPPSLGFGENWLQIMSGPPPNLIP